MRKSKQQRPVCDEDEDLIQQSFEVLRSDPAKAGVALLQRSLRLGYTRAARIMDELEFRELVGPSRGVEPRLILKMNEPIEEIFMKKKKAGSVEQSSTAENGASVLADGKQQCPTENGGGHPPSHGFGATGRPHATAAAVPELSTLNPQPSTSYEEAAAGQRREAVAADLAEINRLQEIIVSDKLTMREKMVSMANAMWRQGQALQRVAGRTQLTFHLFQQFQQQLPFDFETAKRRIALTCRQESEITEWEQLTLETFKLLGSELQMMAVRSAQDIALAGASGSAGPTGVFTLFLNDMVKMKQEWLKTTRAMPLEQQSPDRLQSFLDDTQWVAEERERAAALLRGKAQ